MQVSLKQIEIEQALKQFLSSKGISIHNKDISMSFTAGRLKSGISVEISIEDAFNDSCNVQLSDEVTIVDSLHITEDQPQAEEKLSMPDTCLEDKTDEQVAETPVKVASLFG